MSNALRACKLCNRRLRDFDTWLLHYNSKHSQECRPSITGYRTCLHCNKFIAIEEVPNHRCRRPAQNPRSMAISAPSRRATAPTFATSESVNLEEYFIPCVADSTSTLTATSTKKGTSILAAPAQRNLARSSHSSDGHPRGDPSEPSEAGADTPGRQSGDSGGAGDGPPSKQAEAGPAADRADDRRHSAVAERRGRPSRSSSRAPAPSAATAGLGKKSVPNPPSEEGVGNPLMVGGDSPPHGGGGSQPPFSPETMPSTDRSCCAQVEESSTPVEHSVQAEQSSQVDQNATQIKRSYVQVLKSKPVEQSSDCRVEPAVTSATSGDPLHRAASPLPVEPQPHSASASAHLDSGPALRRSSRAGATTSTLQQRGAPTPPLRGTPVTCPPLSVIASFFPEVNDEESIPSVSAVSSPDLNDVYSLPSPQHDKHYCPHPQCNKRYSTVKDAVKHINRDHKDHFPLPTTYARCSVCKNVYTKDGLKNHKCKGPPREPRPPRAPLQPSPSPEPSFPNPEYDLAAARAPDTDSLHRFYKLELTWTHAKWLPLLQHLHLLLLQRMNSRDVTTSDESFSAYLLLPGFLEAVRISHRLPGAKQLRIEPPINYLRTFTATEHIDHPEQIIMTTLKALYSRVHHSLATRPESHPNQRSKALSKICALTQIGRISKAARLADTLAKADSSDEGLPTSQVTRERAHAAIPELFPAASILDDVGEHIDDEWDLERPLQVTTSDVASSITNLSIDRASGFSGWSNRLLKKLYLGSEPTHQQLIAENYASIFNAILQGRTSDHIRSYLTDVRLCLIPKSDNPLHPTYRPIGVGETIFRLLGRTILAKVGKTIGGQIAPLQLAVGIPGGVEIAASLAGMLDAINDSQPTDDSSFAMMSIDIRNAFNSIRRSHVLQGLRSYCPSLIPFFHLVYGKAVNLRWSDGSIIGTASTGVIQGDPLSTLYFALGIQPLLLDLHAAVHRIEADCNLPSHYRPGLVFAIADDITIQARTDTLFQLSAVLPNLFERYDLPLSPSKTWIMGPQVHLQDRETTIPCRTMRDGGKVLGTPVGTIHFILSWLHAHFRDNRPPLPILGHLPARAAITLLKFSYNSRMVYLRKTSSEAIVNTGIFAEYDDLIDNALLATGVADDRDRIHTLRALPLQKGGIGMPHLNGHHGYRHHLVTAMRAREFLKPTYSRFLHAHTTTFNTRDVDIDGTPPEELAEILGELRGTHPTDDALHLFATALRKWGADADTEAALTFHQHLVDTHEDEAAAVFLSTQGVKQSFILFSTSHRQHSELSLSNQEYIEAMRFLLLSPFKMNVDGFSTCRCRREHPWDLLTHPFHSSNCPLNSKERTFRHSAVCNLLCKLLRRASPASRVSSEPRDSSVPIHPDIAVEENAILFHVDVSVVEPTAVHALAENGGSATTKGAAAGLQEAAKLAKYRGSEWINVIPFVLESTGHLGKEAEVLLAKTTADKPALRAWFLAELSLILARSQGKMRLKSHALLR